MLLRLMLWLMGLLCTALLSLGRADAVNLSRDALWGVVETCRVAKQSLGVTLPCLAVTLGEGATPGTAVLRSPYSQTHVLVVPTAKLAGIEAPALQRKDASTYWHEAL